MLGTLINVGAIFVGGILGLLFRKKHQQQLVVELWKVLVFSP